MSTLAISRGLFRLWLVQSVVWACALTALLWPSERIAWPWSGPPMIHVQISDNETGDYPAAWGVERIKSDVRKRRTDKQAEERKRDQEWAATVPADRKAYCNTLSSTPMEQVPEDCQRLFNMQMGTLTFIGREDWEDQFAHPPLPVLDAIAIIAPLAFGPSVLLLVLGLALAWAISGFRPRVP